MGLTRSVVPLGLKSDAKKLGIARPAGMLGASWGRRAPSALLAGFLRDVWTEAILMPDNMQCRGLCLCVCLVNIIMPSRC